MQETVRNVAKFNASDKLKSGKGPARASRRIGFVPGILYSSHNQKSNANLSSKSKNIGASKKENNVNSENSDSLNPQKKTITPSSRMLLFPIKQVEHECNEGGLLSKLSIVHVDQEEDIMAIVRDVQFHPVTDKPIHIDLQQISPGSLVKVEVRLRVLNDDRSIGIKKGGVLNIVHRRIPVICDPYKIPSFIEVDILKLDIGASLHVHEISFGENVSPLLKSEEAILSIRGRVKEEAPQQSTEEAKK